MKMYPLGIIPEWIWKLERYHEVGNAIERYIDAGLQVNLEWITEYNKLQRELADKI